MSVDEGFWQDILTNPHDDAPRLIYADWLDDNDDPERAEFIRGQIEVESLRGEDPRRWHLEKRHQELLARNRARWNAGIKELVLAEEFRRGFVEGVTVRVDDLPTRADSIFAEAPVRRLTIAGGEGQSRVEELRKVVGLPQLRQLVALRFEMPLSAKAVRVIGPAPHLDGVRELNIVCQDLAASTTTALLRSPLGRRLHELRLRCGLTAEAWGAFADIAPLEHLRALHVHSGLIPDDAMVGLGECVPNLRRLDLSGNYSLSADHLTRLTASALVPGLEELFLNGNGFGSAGLETLLGAQPGNLRRLELASCGLFPPDIQTLARTPLRALRWLNLSNNVVSSSLRELVESESAPALEVLQVRFTGLTDDFIEALADAPAMRNLRWLDLTANRLTSLAARALIDSPWLDQLVRVQLERNDIGPVEQDALRQRFGAGVSV